MRSHYNHHLLTTEHELAAKIERSLLQSTNTMRLGKADSVPEGIKQWTGVARAPQNGLLFNAS